MINNLRLVEIELFSYCNRQCGWCPNNTIDRLSFNKFIDTKVLLHLLKELKENNYDGAITFSRYNEPMSHIKQFKDFLYEIKNELPNNKLITNTNGDFISKENLMGLMLDELTIMDYDGLGIDGCIEVLNKANVIIDDVKYPYIYGHFDSIEILYFVDWQKNRKITDRGGFLKSYSQILRDKPCFEPNYFVGINYDGTVSPCCNIRNDIEQHKPYIIGDLNNNSFSEVLSSYKSNLIKKICNNGSFIKDSPCYMCENSGGRYTRGNGGISYE